MCLFLFIMNLSNLDWFRFEDGWNPIWCRFRMVDVGLWRILGLEFYWVDHSPAAYIISSKQSGLQLTIFYTGTVNLYDDIPADKVWGFKDASNFKWLWARRRLWPNLEYNEICLLLQAQDIMLIASNGNYSSYQKTEVKKLFRLSKDWSQEQIWITDWVEKVSSNSHEVNERIRFHPSLQLARLTQVWLRTAIFLGTLIWVNPASSMQLFNI